MDEVARLPTGDRADLFQASAERRGINPVIVEKDFWVCWTLRRVFALTDSPSGVLFKGGTSLSKAFGLIERFSEDIDLVLDRAGLGFVDDRDPANPEISRKARQRLVDELRSACRHAVDSAILPALRQSFEDAFGTASGWEIIADPASGEDPVLLFAYPRALRRSQARYIRPEVRLEFGARGDPWPEVEASVTPYAAEDFPQPFRAPSTPVRVLAPERTFWEKATILHMLHHFPAERSITGRQSRHYYDLVRMADADAGRRAMNDAGLLAAVADHKHRFFPAAWAKYEEAKPGTLRLTPPGSRLNEIRADYKAMREMMFVEPPSFDDLLARLREVEAQINAQA